MQSPTLNDSLKAGFADAQSHFGWVFLDLFWKFLWFAISAAVLIGLLIWFQMDLSTLQIQVPASPFATPVSAVVLARELWRTYAATLLWAASAFLIFAGLLWVVLEASFRSGFLPTGGATFFSRAAAHASTFLISGIAKVLICGSTLLLIGGIIIARYWTSPLYQWRDLWTAAPLLAGAITWLTVWFLVGFLETLIRAEAADLLANRLFLSAGLIGTLAAFEAMIVISTAGAMGTLITFVSGVDGMLFASLAISLAVLLLSGLHAYLLLVRFSAIAFISKSTGE